MQEGIHLISTAGIVELWILRFSINVFVTQEISEGCESEELLTFLFIENVQEREAWTRVDHKQVQIVISFYRLSFGRRPGYCGGLVSDEKSFSKTQIFRLQFRSDLAWSCYLIHLFGGASWHIWKQNLLVNGGGDCNNQRRLGLLHGFLGICLWMLKL